MTEHKCRVYVCGTPVEFDDACATLLERVNTRDAFTAPEAIQPIRMMLVYEDGHGERLADIVQVVGGITKVFLHDAKGRVWEMVDTMDREQYGAWVAKHGRGSP